MIFDRLDNAQWYRDADGRIAAALDYLERTDFAKVESGRYPIDGDRVFALVQRYQTRPVAQITWEAHRKYIDVQYLAEGDECMGCALMHDGVTVTQPYDAKEDAVLFNVTDGTLVQMRAGTFVILGPADVHAPGLASPAGVAPVVKVVVKCMVDGWLNPGDRRPAAVARA